MWHHRARTFPSSTYRPAPPVTRRHALLFCPSPHLCIWMHGFWRRWRREVCAPAATGQSHEEQEKRSMHWLVGEGRVGEENANELVWIFELRSVPIFSSHLKGLYLKCNLIYLSHEWFFYSHWRCLFSCEKGPHKSLDTSLLACKCTQFTHKVYMV